MQRELDGEPVLDLPSVAEFDAWLEAWSPATGPRGVWLRIARKGAGLTSITADETVACATAGSPRCAAGVTTRATGSATRPGARAASGHA